MKRNSLFTVLLLIAFIFHYNTVRAQFFVDYDGSVTAGLWQQDATSSFNVFSNLDSFSADNLVYFNASNKKQNALQIINTPNSTSNTSSWIIGQTISCNILAQKTTKGLEVSSYSSSSVSNNSKAYGILSSAGNAKSGYNYGICTSLSGSNNGTGLFASSGSYPNAYEITGKYAGYFDGNVKVIGNVTATTVTTTSDLRLKNNIRQIENGSLSKIMEMNVVRYGLKNQEVNILEPTEEAKYLYSPDSDILKQEHIGLIAQELQQIYPELVNEGDDGYLSVNYIEIVPILIKSIQELKTKVDILENEAAKSIQKGNENAMIGGLNLQAILYQNDPNPFTENTTIKCLIPSSIQNAQLYIYDMNGHQIDRMTISERGNASLTIEGSSLDAGMYLYSLITDGAVVDTKRMILTK